MEVCRNKFHFVLSAHYWHEAMNPNPNPRGLIVSQTGLCRVRFAEANSRPSIKPTQIKTVKPVCDCAAYHLSSIYAHPCIRKDI